MIRHNPQPLSQRVTKLGKGLGHARKRPAAGRRHFGWPRISDNTTASRRPAGEPSSSRMREVPALLRPRSHRAPDGTRSPGALDAAARWRAPKQRAAAKRPGALREGAEAPAKPARAGFFPEFFWEARAAARRQATRALLSGGGETARIRAAQALAEDSPRRLSPVFAMPSSSLRASRSAADFLTSQLIKLINAISNKMTSCSIWRQFSSSDVNDPARAFRAPAMDSRMPVSD